MASGHTHEVRVESVTIEPGISFIRGTKDLRQAKSGNLFIFQKNYRYFFLHRQTVIDINPIVKAIVTGADPRHCSTTFYQ